MKRIFKICTTLVVMSIVLSVFTGCEFWNNIVSQLGGNTDDYTLTNGYTYSDTDGTTKISLIHTGEENGFKYKLYSDHVEITGYSGEITDIEIPSKIEGTLVTEIGTNAFRESTLTSVKIPDSVNVIREEAFYNAKNLLEVTFGNAVQTVGRSAFFGCDNLISVYLNDGLRVIGDYAFGSCLSLDSIIITDGVESIGTHAFYLCKSMFKIYISGNVSEFGEDIFGSCHQNFKIYAPMSSPAYIYARNNSLLYVECYNYLEDTYNSDTNDADISFDDDHEHGDHENTPE